jgi:hypothetical protein
MIEISGPFYRYNNEVLTKPEIIFVKDHHYNETEQCFPLQKLLDNSTCDPTDHLIVFDHVVQEDDIFASYNCACLPIFLARAEQQFNCQQINPDWNQKRRTFNFMINKIRHNRTFLLMLLEHFDLIDYEYTLCWKNNNVGRNEMLNSINNLEYQQIITSAKLNIATRQYLFGTENLLDQGLQYGALTNAQVYQTFLQKEVFEPTCISLITEPGFFERETIVTEKTIMSIYAGTIPIWVGGWRIADYMKSQGFDVFDDVVDHSYQTLTDPWDRCYHAIKLNIDLLKDYDRVKLLIKQNQHRLLNNLNLLKNNYFHDAAKQGIKRYSLPSKIL